GGALGAYQGGVFQVLEEHGFNPSWVVGTSIGAINSALIAGNRPEHRLARLTEFWNLVARADVSLGAALPPFATWLGPVVKVGSYLDTITRGVPGFFVPRPGMLLNIEQQVPTPEASFYDTSPLHKTLERLVDFDYLNAGHVRCTVCAVDVGTGELAVFDSAKERLTAKHIMASGALPPGFPPVIINGRAYWDGGIYSNTPADIVLDDAERKNTLCFMVDLWDPTEQAPRSISAAMARQKDIQYSSRTREHLEDHRDMQNMRRAINILASRLPEKDREDPEIRRLTSLGCRSTINIVRLIMKALPGDDHNKDVDFAQSSLEARWKAGAHDARRALRHKSWLKPMQPHIGMVIHELPQED
ncbi:MAG: patatin-like phospholipase family protein, partial [Aquabacterium sp.]|uniref:patatin-like phospholipase family protein n=1 Tax=Aquabacterium sp. TaxID=1872578 RepID=UPI001225E12A